MAGGDEVLALGQLQDPSSIDPLISLLKSADQRTKWSFDNALRMCQSAQKLSAEDKQKIQTALEEFGAYKGPKPKPPNASKPPSAPNPPKPPVPPADF